jgi:phenylpropionate dioxygenase-like ring-hydroxylating dioxygenase large terminal subunit
MQTSTDALQINRHSRSSSTQDQHFLEASFYTDPKWPPLERQSIFQKVWLYAGDVTELSQPGATKVVEIGGQSLLIVRTTTGHLTAFHNVCMHRASPLLYEPGLYHCKHLVCPYHGWVYDLDGKLLGTPASKRFPEGFSMADFPLRSVRLETWNDFMFICLDPTAPSLLEFLAPIPDTLVGYRTETTQRLLTRTYTVACNWKNFHDNTLCDYHVAIAHRKTLSPIQGPIPLYEHEFTEYVNLLYSPLPDFWYTTHRTLPHLSKRCHDGFFTYGIFPNLHLVAMPDGLLAWIQIIPQAVDTCQVQIEVYGIPAYYDSIDAVAADFNAVTQEDIRLTEGVQRGYTSGVYKTGIANGLEARIIHHQNLFRRYLKV